MKEWISKDNWFHWGEVMEDEMVDQLIEDGDLGTDWSGSNVDTDDAEDKGSEMEGCTTDALECLDQEVGKNDDGMDDDIRVMRAKNVLEKWTGFKNLNDGKNSKTDSNCKTSGIHSGSVRA